MRSAMMSSSASWPVASRSSAPPREIGTKHLRRKRNIHLLEALHKARPNAGGHHAANHLAFAHALVLENKQIGHSDRLAADAGDLRDMGDAARSILHTLKLYNHMDRRGDLLANRAHRQ